MGSHYRDGPSAAVPTARVATYRCAVARPSLQVQVDRMLADLEHLSVYTSRQDPAGARGVALALAHSALLLAVTPLSDAQDRRRRADILRGTVVPALGPAGLDHVERLIEVALAYDGHPARVVEGVRTEQ